MDVKTAKALVKIIQACAANGVKSLKMAEADIEFGQAAQPEIQEVFPNIPVAAEITELNLDGRPQPEPDPYIEEANLILEDPLEWQRLQTSNEGLN